MRVIRGRPGLFTLLPWADLSAVTGAIAAVLLGCYGRLVVLGEVIRVGDNAQMHGPARAFLLEQLDRSNAESFRSGSRTMGWVCP